MDNYALVIDISSDEEKNRYSTPIKTLPVNMVGRLILSDSSVEVWRGSETDLDSSQTSISTFNSEPEEEFIAEKQKEDESDDYYEEPDSPRVMPKLTPLGSSTGKHYQYGKTRITAPNKTEKLDDLGEPPATGIRKSHDNKLDDEELYCTAGRGNCFVSTKTQRLKKQHVRIVREVPHCTGMPVSKAICALSRPAPGRSNFFREEIHRHTTGLGHGKYDS